MTMSPWRLRPLGPVVIGALFVAGCGDSPTRPSTPTNSTAAFGLTQTAVATVVLQAQTTNQTVAAIPPRVPGSTVVTHACPGGGSMVMTFDRPTPALDIPDSHWSTIARAEPRDCRTGDLIVNGDPYLQMDSEISFPGTANPTAGISVAMKMTGSLRFDGTRGSRGRVTYDCRQTITSGASLDIRWAGTISWTLDNGDVIVSPCGPA